VTGRFPERVAIATRNTHKLREIGRICADWPVAWLTIENHEGPWPEVEEPHDTYLENALAKAREVAAALGVPALADDSGIEVDALGGAPGPRSARYAGEGATDQRNLAALLEALRGVPAGGRTARYRCVAALAWPDTGEVWAEGTCEGTLTARPRGVGGFGYDPAFVPEGGDLTMAELSSADKDRVSHRGRAFRSLRDRLAAGSGRPPDSGSP
jgi:XTP/dITP diphosphohydrolase